jgi:glycerate kinase
LSRRLARLAQLYLEERGVDVTGLAGAGAGGGLPGGLASIGAELVQGFDVVSESIGLYDMIEDVDLVITGEGRVDATSFAGKVVGGIVELAAEAGVPVVAVAGDLDSSACSPPIPVRTLVDAVGRERALGMTAEAVAEVTAAALAEIAPR